MTEFKTGLPAEALAQAQELVLALVKDSADAGRDHDLAVRRLLTRTVDYFGVQAGFVSEIFNGIATVEAVAGEAGGIAAGATVPIAGAPCEQSMQSDRPVVLTRPNDEAVLARLPVDGLSTYIGARLLAGGRVHGTVCLVSPEARAGGCSTVELGVFETAVALIGQHVALRRADERYDLAMRGSNAGFWYLDVRRGEVALSSRFLEIMGLDAAMTTMSLDRFLSHVHPDDEAAVQAAIVRHFAEPVPFDVEHRMNRPDGRSIWVHAHGDSLRGADGRPVRLAGSAHDITDRRAAEEMAAAHAEALKASNAELERFAYVASHDLQEPLRKVRAFGDLLHRDYSDRLDARGHKLLDTMIDGAGRMQKLIQDLLSYSRSSHVAMAMQVLDMEKLVLDVASDFELALAETGGTICWDLPGRLVADPVLMRQLLANLIGNAVKYRDPKRPQRIELSLVNDEAGNAVLSVRDNGIGFPPEHATRIFEIFTRLHSRGDYPGTGVGLALCQRIAERHGGRIWAEGRPGEGAAFHVHLPTTEQ
ncbi:ATP-binding protein [Maricaulis sp.]|uniref:sensor histidine kinase n=1 Tax=Maricaulis sp. TaxID=1486257 RepID=UPI00329722B3